MSENLHQETGGKQQAANASVGISSPFSRRF